MTSDLGTYPELQALASDRVCVVNNYHGLMPRLHSAPDVVIYTCLGEAFSCQQFQELCQAWPNTFVILVTTRRYQDLPQLGDRYRILQVPSAYAWYAKHIPQVRTDPAQRQLTRRFLSLNNRAQWNRQALLQMIRQHDLGSQFFFSYWNHDRWNQGSRALYDHHQSVIGRTWFNRDIDHAQLFQELPVTTGIDDFQMDGNDWSVGHEAYYQHSFCSVVNETYIDENHDAFFTEKIMKPLAFQHPFLLFSSASALQQLQHLGFQTFPEYFDESYDHIESPQQRLEHVFREILRVSAMSEPEITAMLTSMIPRLRHNHDLFWHQWPGIYQHEMQQVIDTIHTILTKL